MEMPVKRIDTSLCNACGECIRICRSNEAMGKGGDGFPVYAKEHKCIYCGHCLAVCPTGAISFTRDGMVPEGEYYADSRGIKGAAAAPDAVLELLSSLRSTRFFDGKEVEREKTESVLEAMVRAPSAGNEQNRNFHIFHGRDAVDGLDADIAAHYRGFSSKMANPLAAGIAAKAMAKKDRSGIVMRNRTIADLPRKEREALYRGLFADLAERNKRSDLSFFYSASAAILVTANVNTPDFHKPFHKADVEIAVTYGTIAAAALGLGSCRMGLSEIAFGADRKLREKYGIPAEERVHGILALGYPAVKWMRIPPRGPVKAVWMRPR